MFINNLSHNYYATDANLHLFFLRFLRLKIASNYRRMKIKDLFYILNKITIFL